MTSQITENLNRFEEIITEQWEQQPEVSISYFIENMSVRCAEV